MLQPFTNSTLSSLRSSQAQVWICQCPRCMSLSLQTYSFSFARRLCTLSVVEHTTNPSKDQHLNNFIDKSQHSTAPVLLRLRIVLGRQCLLRESFASTTFPVHIFDLQTFGVLSIAKRRATTVDQLIAFLVATSVIVGLLLAHGEIASRGSGQMLRSGWMLALMAPVFGLLSVRHDDVSDGNGNSVLR